MGNRYAVIDFETTGLSPQGGDRITEVAVVMIEAGFVVDQFQSLVKSGAHIPYEVESLTGISNQMLINAPEAYRIIPDLYRFIGRAQLVAHNASFDSKFFRSELERLGFAYTSDFICTLLLSRRLYQHSYNLKLQTLVNYHGLNSYGSSHRALADALTTAELFLRIESDLRRHYSLASITPQKILRAQKEALKNFAVISYEIHQEKNRSDLRVEMRGVVRETSGTPIGGKHFQKNNADHQVIEKPDPLIAAPEPSRLDSVSKTKGNIWYMPFIYLVLGIFAFGFAMQFPIALIPMAIIGWFLFK